MISKYFTREFSQYRLSYSDSVGEYELFDTFNCYIEQDSFENRNNRNFDSSYSKSYIFYTDITRDIREGDKLIYNSIEFKVKGLKYFNIGRNKHIEIICQKDDDEYAFISL